MPLPQVTQLPPPPAPTSRRRLFVSYSHRDLAEYGQDFIKYLVLTVRGYPDLGYREEDIFFDRDELRAGDDWDQKIQTALEEAGALIFLVSADSLISKYCVERELAAAIRPERRIPVVPVVLNDCPWQVQPLPGDPRGLRLGSLEAVPKNDALQLQPVSQWPDRSRAWNRVMQQLVAALGKPVAAAETALVVPAVPAARAATVPVPPLLPYFCDQGRLDRDFNQGVRHWRSAALVVLVKGSLDDRAPRFWDRLRLKNLTDYAVAELQTPILEQRPLKWPSAMDDGKLLRRQDLEIAVVEALSDALTGNAFAVDSPPKLARHLAELGGIRPLMATLPAEPVKALCAGLRALLAWLEGCPADSRLERLVLALIVEDESLIVAADWLRAIKPREFARSRIVELDRLAELQRDDVRAWHREQQLERYVPLDEPALVELVFGQTDRIRSGPFANKLRPLLGVV